MIFFHETTVNYLCIEGLTFSVCYSTSEIYVIICVRILTGQCLKTSVSTCFKIVLIHLLDAFQLHIL